MASAAGTRPTSCWCAGRPSNPTGLARWRRWRRRCLMRVAVYARVSTPRQAQAQSIEQQLDRLRTAVAEHGWTLADQHVYRDDGYSGASLGRPGLDRLRDHAALAELDVVLVTAPDRLGAGTLLPWTRPPFGYRLDPERPRQAAGVRVEPSEAVLVAQLFDWYLQPGATLYRVAKRLTDLAVATPMGKPRWNVASVRGILQNPAYTGLALTNRTRVVPARTRKSALVPVGPGESHAARPPEEWIGVPVPALVAEEVFAQVQEKLATNQQGATRH